MVCLFSLFASYAFALSLLRTLSLTRGLGQRSSNNRKPSKPVLYGHRSLALSLSFFALTRGHSARSRFHRMGIWTRAQLVFALSDSGLG